MSKISLEEIKEISNLIEEIIKSDSFLRSSHSGFDYKLFDTKFCFELAKRLDQQHDENSGDEQDENDCKDLNRMLINNTDIIPNQYEGGFRVWEGLYDLIHFFAVEKFFEHFSKSKISSRDSETIMICDVILINFNSFTTKNISYSLFYLRTARLWFWTSFDLY